jgi:hypothetical protein
LLIGDVCPDELILSVELSVVGGMDEMMLCKKWLLKFVFDTGA